MMRALINLLVVLTLLVLPACGKTSSTHSPTGPSDQTPVNPLDPNVPPAGLDTGWKQLVDGAGNPGPLRARLLWVDPSPGSMIPILRHPTYGDGAYVAFKYEVCMDSVANPNNNPNLEGMQIAVEASRDGRPLPPPGPGVIRYADHMATPNGIDPWNVRNGACVIVKRIPVELGGIPGNQFIFLSPGSNHLILIAYYRLGVDTSRPVPNNGPCPSMEQIGSMTNQPRCTLRTTHFLDYKW